MTDTASMLRRGRRLIKMVSELHGLGYQRLRIMPYEHPLAWRLAIGPADIFTPTNGAWVSHSDFSLEKLAIYSSASQADYFQWGDAHADNARQLAEKFRLRFPILCEQGKGRDWAYAGWMRELLAELERLEALPVIMEGNGAPPAGCRSLPLRRYGMDLPDHMFDLPPLAHRAVPSINTAEIGAENLPRISQGEPAKDLTQFGSVASLIGIAMAVGVQMFEQRDKDAGHELLLPVAHALAGNDGGYLVNGPWCQLTALGEAITVGLDLPPNFIPDATLEDIVLFGLEHISLGVQCILRQTEAEADWDGVTAPLLMEVQAFSTCAFMGTASALYPGRTLESFLQTVGP